MIVAWSQADESRRDQDGSMGPLALQLFVFHEAWIQQANASTEREGRYVERRSRLAEAARSTLNQGRWR